jgi:DNA replication protein DnaC
LNKQFILDLNTPRFIENKKKVLFIRNSGVGKTHLAISLGVTAGKTTFDLFY